MNFEYINQIGRMEYLPTQKLINLTVEKKYKISLIEKVKTKYGDKVFVELEDSFGVFLPGRMSKVFIEEKPDVLENMIRECKDKKNIYLQYFGGVTNKIEFGYLSD